MTTLHMSGCQTCDAEGVENCPVHGDVVTLDALGATS